MVDYALPSQVLSTVHDFQDFSHDTQVPDSHLKKET